MEVRAAVAADVSELARLWREFSAYYAELDPERFRVPEVPPELATGRWLVADDDGEIVGFAVGEIMPPHPEADSQLLTDATATRLGIGGVFVVPAHRRRGIAAALIAALEEWGRAEGAAVVLAETAVDSPSPCRFWIEPTAMRAPPCATASGSRR